MSAETDTPLDEAPPQERPKLTLQINVDKPSACKRHVTVTVSREDIERYFHEAFDEFQPAAEVPGFRPGKAPRKLVESRFREHVAKQVKGSLLMDSVTQASEECAFSAISEPDFDFEAIELPEEGPMTFEFDLEVRPEFDLPEWKGLTLERSAHQYSDTEIDEQLRSLLARYGRLVNKDGPIEPGDRVTLDIIFTGDGQVLSTIEDVTVAVAEKLSFQDGNLDGFDKLVLGAQAGDKRTGQATVSTDAENEALRGKTVDAELRVKSVKRLELPELTPAFLDRIGGFEDEEDLRGAVRLELERQLNYYQQRQLRNQITALLTRSANWELPQDMLRRQARRELQRAVLELRASGFNDETIRAHQNQLRQNSLTSTERALKEHFILERIAEAENIEAEPQDFETEIRMIALQSQDSPRRVRARLEKRGQMDSLRNQIIERKVIDRITQHASVTDRPFEPSRENTAAIDRAIGGHEDQEEIPDAKYEGEAEELKAPAERG
jgi:trigger factor